MKRLAVAGGVLLLVAAVAVAANAGALTPVLAPGLPGPVVTVSGGAVIVTGGPHVGDAAPDLALRGLDGRTVRLSDFAGRPVLLTFWASWCPPCKSEMPRFEAAYAAGDLVVLGVDTLDVDDEADARAAVRNLGVTFPVVFDEQRTAQRLYAVRGLPTTFLVGADGRVLAVQPGEVSQAQLDGYVAQVK